MKYMLLIYSNPAVSDAFSEEEMQGIFNEVETIMGELRESGEWAGGAALADVSRSKTVRVCDRVPAVTDGPYLEAKEHLAGYCIFDCETLDRALEIAARWPDARYTAVELRPLMHDAGTEM